MNTLIAFFSIGAILGLLFLGWLYTKKGKEWLSNL